MVEKKYFGLSLKLMSVLGGVSVSTLYKFVQSNGMEPVPTAAKRGVRYPIEATRVTLGHFFSSKHKISKNKKRIAGFHFKGGTGKSSISTEAAVMLSLLGYKVLLVDGDQQGHASHALGMDYSDKHYTLYDSVKNNIAARDIVVKIFEGLDCIPANLSLAEIDEKLKDIDSKERVKLISQILSDVEGDYDFVIFDTAPSITDLNRSIFYYADVLGVVCDTQPQSVQSLEHIMEYIEVFCEKYSKKIPEILIIPNKYEDRASSSVETMSYLKKNWEKYIIPEFAVRKSEDFPKSFLEQMPLSLLCKVNSIAFEDMAQVVRHIVNLCEER
jgi:chromosome partitioning protein